MARTAQSPPHHYQIDGDVPPFTKNEVDIEIQRLNSIEILRVATPTADFQ